MIQCQVEIITSCRDRLNDLEELIYSMGPKRVNVPSKMEQLSFLTSKICPSTVLGSLVRNFSWRSEWVSTSVHTLTNLYVPSGTFLHGLRLKIITEFSLAKPWNVLMTLGIQEYVNTGQLQTYSSIPWAIIDDRHSGLRPPLSLLRTCCQQMIREVPDGKVQPRS